MKIGDKVRVVNNCYVYSTYQKMADVMGLKKFHYMSDSLRIDDAATILSIQTHLRNMAEGLVIGCYCERLDEDFIINIKGVETMLIKPLSEYKVGTQNWDILAYLHKYGYITAMFASSLGITQLAARITELQVDGYVFTRTKVIPADNGKKWYYEYSLDKDK